MDKHFLLMVFVFLIMVITSCQSESKSYSVSSGSNAFTNDKSNAKITNSSHVSESVPKPSEEEIRMVIANTKPVFDSWVTAAKLIAVKTKNQDAELFVSVLENNCYARVIRYEGLPTSQIITEPKHKNKPSVCFLLQTQDLVREMPELADPSRLVTAASYLNGNVVINGLPQYAATNQYLKGLILHHEMVHWAQDKIDGLPPGAHPGKEVDAYEFEFGLLDILNLPGYSGFISAESSRKDLFPNNPYLYDPRINAMFGSTGSDTERMMLATIIYFRVVFKYFEKNPQTAESNKLNFIASVYN